MNRLSDAKGSYRKHSALQPAHWFEHTEGAVAEAKRQHKPHYETQ